MVRVPMSRDPGSPAAFARLLATSVLASVSLGCQPRGASRDVLVVGTDYAFQVPGELSAGPTDFRFANRGLVPHEMALGKLRAGVTSDSLLAYAAAGNDPGDLADGVVGILISEPGKTAIGTLKTDLTPGRVYMMICNFRDGDSLPPHIVMGMQSSFVVK